MNTQISKNNILYIGLSGAGGRMGKAIADLTASQLQFQITAKHDSKNPLEEWKPSHIDAVIDFSSTQALSSVLSWCVSYKKPLVSGTTGLNLQDKQKIKESSSCIPLLWTPNTSLGIACMNEWLKSLPQTLKKWSVRIEETHHQFKKDKPSGTALFLQQTLKKEGVAAPEPASQREGDSCGVHQVHLTSSEEILSIKHTALDRKVFARGALRAVEWIVCQKPGLYSMQDVL